MPSRPGTLNTPGNQPGIFREKVRWAVCGLLFFATTVNYLDRQVLGILKPTLEKELGWNEDNYGTIVSTFQIAYALMMPIAGRLIDYLGTRLGSALAVIVWSIASMLHSLAGTPFQFQIVRFGLGLGEAANFPAALKATADWFPRKERAFATGIFNSGTNLGALIAPLMVPFVATHFGWRMSFIATASFDLVWLVIWLAWYRRPEEHKSLTTAERTLIESDRTGVEDEVKVPFLWVVKQRASWAYLAGKFMTDPVWWFYLFWVPGFLHDAYGLNLTQLGLPLVVIYLAADVGSILGGWISRGLMSRGWEASSARKTAMLICACSVTPVSLIMFTGGNLWLTVALLSLAASAHQGWMANLFTLPSDTFPRKAVASVVGFGGMGGALAGGMVAKAVGMWLDYSHKSYGPLFIWAGSAYLIALLIIHTLVPKLQPVEVD